MLKPLGKIRAARGVAYRIFLVLKYLLTTYVFITKEKQQLQGGEI